MSARHKGPPIMLHPHYWREWQSDMVRRHYATANTAALAEAIGRTVKQVHLKARKLGVYKSREFIAAEARANNLHLNLGTTHGFKPGHKPWNAGLKGAIGCHPNKRGCIQGRAKQLWVPVGSYRINAEGYLDRKYSDEPGQQTKRWRAAHRLVWEAAHGPVPAGYVVTFKPGMRTTDPERITLDVLELITQRENMRRNSVHTRLPPDLARVVQLRGALTRQINRRLRAQQQRNNNTPPRTRKTATA